MGTGKSTLCLHWHSARRSSIWRRHRSNKDNFYSLPSPDFYLTSSMEQLIPSCCVSCQRHPPKLLEDANFSWILWLYQKKGRNPRSLVQVLQENDHFSHFFKEAEIIFGHINVKEESRRGKLMLIAQHKYTAPRQEKDKNCELSIFHTTPSPM